MGAFGNAWTAGARLGGLLLCASVANGAVIYVDDSATGSNDGTSWTDAFVDLQDALAIALSGDEIRIGQGLYRPDEPSGDRASTFALVDGVVLQGGYAGVGAPDPDALDPAAYPTVLSGDLNGDDGPTFQNNGENVYHVLTALNVGDTTIVRGVTITGGNADFCSTYECKDPEASGGGVVVESSGLQFEDSLITRNRAYYGGAGVRIISGTPSFVRCRFDQNSAAIDGSIVSYGGAVYSDGTATFSGCDFVSNHAGWYAGAVRAGFNGAMFRSCNFISNKANEAIGTIGGSYLVVVDCVFDNNEAPHGTGAISCSNSTIVNCRFTRHTMMLGQAHGAALSLGTNNLVANCHLSGNGANLQTVAVSNVGNTITNCTIVGNSSSWSHAGIRVWHNGQATISNCVVWDNVGEFKRVPQIVVLSEASINHCTVQDWDGSLGGQGNTGADPQFIDADGPDDVYGTKDDNPRLSQTSPARDAGNNTFLPNDEHDLDEDGDTDELLPLDLDLLQRIVGGTVDMGAFEVQKDCPADISPSAGDGQVTVMDLLAVINGWGDTGPGHPGDIDGDGVVDEDDLFRVIDDWGACR